MADRVLYQDVKLYELPSSLDALDGPTTGDLQLPLAVYWGPDPVADLDTLTGVTKAYQATIREGRSSDQEALLSRELLQRHWGDLLLPVRVRQLWESAFPELVQ